MEKTEYIWPITYFSALSRATIAERNCLQFGIRGSLIPSSSASSGLFKISPSSHFRPLQAAIALTPPIWAKSQRAEKNRKYSMRQIIPKKKSPIFEGGRKLPRERFRLFFPRSIFFHIHRFTMAMKAKRRRRFVRFHGRENILKCTWQLLFGRPRPQPQP